VSYTILIQTEAWLEIQSAYDWYEEQKEGLGDIFLEEIEICYNILTENPARFPFKNHLYRRIRTDRFPYILMYEIEEDKIIITRVRHIKQAPL
jgi:toxin ParE1/3/4